MAKITPHFLSASKPAEATIPTIAAGQARLIAKIKLTSGKSGLLKADGHGRYNSIVTSLQEYVIQNYNNKTVTIDPTDWGPGGEAPEKPIEYGMYGRYTGGTPADCKVYFKREKSLDFRWEENVEPIPFSAEERYFTGGKNFSSIWDTKDIDISCLFRVAAYTEGDDLRRGNIKRIVNEHYKVMGNITYASKAYDSMEVEPLKEIEESINGIDVSLYKFTSDEALGRPRRHHRTYYQALLRTKIISALLIVAVEPIILAFIILLSIFF